METFLDRIASQILNSEENLKDICVVLPSQRAAVFLKRALKSKLDKPSFTPLILTIDEFVYQLVDDQKMDHISQLIELYRAKRNAKIRPEESFDEFLNWAPLALVDFSEIDKYLVDAEKVLSYLADVKRIEKWNLEPDFEMTPLMQHYFKFWESLAELYKRFNEHLLQIGRTYSARVYRKIALNFENHSEKIKELAKEFLFVGFSALNNAEEEIFLKMESEFKTQFYWDIDKYYFKNEKQEAGKFLRESKIIQRLQNKGSLLWEEDFYRQKPMKIDIYELNGANLEAGLTNQLLSKLSIKEQGETAVVLANEDHSLTFLSNLSAKVEKLNLTMGMSLKHSPWNHFFSTLIQMQIEAETAKYKDSEGRPKYYFKHWDRLLGNSVVQWMGEYELSSAIRRVLRDGNWVYASYSDLEKLSDRMEKFQLKSFLNSHLELDDFYKKLSEFAESFLENDTLLERTKAELYGFFKCFNQIRLILNEEDIELSHKTTQSLLQQYIIAESVDLVGEPLEGLQMMGVLETRLLDFKRVIICSVNEGSLPKGEAMNSLIPLDVKREWGLPTHIEQDAIYAYHFYRLFHRAENITITYNSSVDALKGGEPSRFIKQLEYEFKDYYPQLDLNKIIIDSQLKEDLREELLIEKTPAIMEALDALAEKGISPSSLIVHEKSPVDFYNQKLLKLREYEDIEEVMGNHTLGTAIHRLMEDLFLAETSTPENPIFEVSLKKLDHLLEGQNLENKMDFYLKEQNLKAIHSGKNLLMREAAVVMARKVISSERDQLKKVLDNGGSLDIIGLEEKLESSITLSNGKKVKLIGTVDRIDSLNGELRIIDYKSGALEPADLKIPDFDTLWGEKGKHKALQLLFYAMLYSDTYGVQDFTAGIIGFRKPSLGLMNFHFDKTFIIGYEIIEQFKEELKSKLEDMFNPELPFTAFQDQTKSEEENEYS